jgi:glycosyltransferase XagB
MNRTTLESERTAPQAWPKESHRAKAAARPYPAVATGPLGRKAASGPSPLLGILAARGLSPRQIAAVAAGANAHGVSIADYVTGNGFLSAEALYRCVAHHLGVPFVWTPPQLREADAEDVAKLGFALLAPASDRNRPEIIAAPRGAHLDQLILGAHPLRQARMPFALTTPQILEQALRAQTAEKIAKSAAHDLARRNPALSAHTRATKEETAIASMGVALLAAVALTFPVFSGISLALVFFAVIALRLFAFAASFTPAMSVRSLKDAELPIYTIVVALYREESVVAHLLDALERLDYPRAKLDVKIVVEVDDAQTIAALRRVRSRFPFEILVAPRGAPRTKPRALNVALPFARGSLLCVFDAEDQPDARQLRHAADVFAHAAPDIACLQARLVVDNYADNWLTRLYAIDYATLFEVTDPGLANMMLPVPLGGSSNHFRTDILREAGGWDAWNVTEDADLGVRLARFGYRVATIDSETLEEVPAAIRAFLRQRTRWLKGWMQTLFVNLRNPAQLVHDLGLLPATCTVLGLGSAIVGALLWPVFTLWLLSDAVYGPLLAPQTPNEIVNSTIWCFNALFGALALLGPFAVAMKRQKLQRLWLWVILWPAYQLLITAAAWYALIELWRNPFGWAKTEHGLAKSSRGSRSMV